MAKHAKRATWRPRPQCMTGLLMLCLLAVGAALQTSPASTMRGAPTIQAPQSALATPHQPATALPVNCAAVPCLALTFDDGPDPAVTPHILDQLKQQHVRATFFLIGNRAARFPGVVRQIYEAGDEIGSHSWNHPDLTKLSPAQVEAQVSLAQGAIIAAGVPAPYTFRPPYGALNAMVRAHIPLAIAMWNIDPEDWNTKDPKQISDRIIAQARPGGVIDLHDIHQPTADALSAALPNLKSRFQLVTFSQLFNLAPGERGEFYGR